MHWILQILQIIPVQRQWYLIMSRWDGKCILENGGNKNVPVITSLCDRQCIFERMGERNVYIIMPSTQLYTRAGILFTSWQQLKDSIISMRGEVWGHKTSLILPLFIEVPVACLESEQAFICVLGVLIFPLLLRFYY